MNNITYNWVIAGLNCAPTENGLSNVVKSISWEYVGKDSNSTQSSIYGLTDFPSPTPENFTSFNQLDLPTVSQWLESRFNIVKMQKEIHRLIDIQNNPPIVTLQLPNA